MTDDTRPDRAPAAPPDRVAAAGAVLALASLALLPFVRFRPNRIATGVGRAFTAAGPVGWALFAVAAVSLALAMSPTPLPPRRRALALKVASGGLLALLAWSLGSATLSLSEGAPPFARVSLDAAAWVTAAGALMIAFAALRAGLAPAARWTVDALTLAAVVASVRWGGLAQLSLAKEYVVQAERLWGYIGRHASVSLTGVAAALVVGVPLGVLAARSRAVRGPALAFVGVIQTVPSLALLGLLVVPLAALGLSGIGDTPAIVALTLYALLPIVRNTYLGLTQIDPAAVDAGRGMGMSGAQLLLRVQAPLALPLVLEGVRLALVLDIGIAAVMVFAGAQTLGVPVVFGLGQRADDLVLIGAIPMVLMALAADLGMRAIGRAVVSPGLRSAR